MLTTKLFAGLAAMLTVLAFAVRLRGLPPVLVYLGAIAALTCGVFAFTYFIAERWMKNPITTDSWLGAGRIHSSFGVRPSGVCISLAVEPP